MLRFWKKQFQLSKFYLIHNDPGVFIASQWQKNKTEPNFKYLMYRTAIMLIFFVTWIMTIIKEAENNGLWPIFLTNWGYTACTLQATLAFIMLFTTFIGSTLDMPQMKEHILWLYPLYWLLNIVATATAFAITTVYWTTIYNAKTMVFDALNYFVHGNNSILVFIDLWIVAHPVMPFHVVYSIIFGIIYSVFTFIYYSAGGRGKEGTLCIYKIVDWDRPGLTVGVCLGVIAFLIVIHFLMVLISLVRRNLQEKCCSKKLDITMMQTKKDAAYVNEAMSADIV